MIVFEENNKDPRVFKTSSVFILFYVISLCIMWKILYMTLSIRVWQYCLCTRWYTATDWLWSNPPTALVFENDSELNPQTDTHTDRRTDGAAAASTSTSRTHAKQHSRISVVSENWRFLACSKEHCRHSIRSRCKNIPKYFFWNYQKNAKSHPVGQCCCSDAVVLCHRVLHYKINSSRTPFTSTWVFFNESINQRGFWKTQYWFFCRRISTEIGRNGICGKV